jgi:SPP1 Gp6-like portal protein
MADYPDLTRAVKEINEHADAYRLANKMYRNQVDEIFASTNRIAQLLKESSRHYRTNIAAAPVDAVLNGLEVTSVTIPGTDGEANEDLTQQFKERVWDANQLDLYLPDWLREVGKEGDAYLVVWEGEEEGTCEIHLRKPVGARMFYREDNEREAEFFAYMWKEVGKKRVRVNLMYEDRVEKFVSRTEDPKSDKDFQPFEEDGDGGWPIAHDYGQVAAFHGRTDHPYGVPDHFNAYGPQNQLNKLIATDMASVDFTGFPQRAALQDAPIEDDGDLWDADDNESTGGTGIEQSGQSNLKSHPGSLWMLKNTKSLISLPAADADNFLKREEQAIRLASVATGTPMRFFVGTNGQAPSGASIREDDARLTSRKQARMRMAGATLQDAFTFAMRKILGFKDCPPVVINWQPAQRAETLDEWETIAAKQGAGVPRDDTLLEAGYTPNQIREWNTNSPNPGEGLGERIALMERLAGAAEKLAAAAELGALDISLVQDLMAGFLPAPLDGNGNPKVITPTEEEGPSLKQQAEMVQKIYLGVPSVLSREEARAMLAAAGIDIDPGAPAPAE